MDPTAQTLTLSVVLTAAGATAAATFITGIIALAKNVPGFGPALDKGWEPVAAMALTAALVLLAGFNAHVSTLEGYFGLVVAWYGISELAMAIHDRAATVTAPKPATPA